MPRRSRPPILFLGAAAVIVVVCAGAVGALLAGRGSGDAPGSGARASLAEATHVARPASHPAQGAPPRHPAPAGSIVHGASAKRMAVPVLMYHVLGSPPAGAGLPELWVSKARFVEQLKALRSAGYEAVTLHAVVNAWRGGSPLPRHPVVLSFDDGYLSHATVAAPAMRRYGWPGVENVTTHNLGPDGLPRHLAQAMSRDGWEFDSHTLTHPDLREISDAQLKDELTGSRREIAKLTGTTPEFFCYPAGKYDAHVEAAVKAAGYAGATTVEPGIATRSDDPFGLPRVRITNADTGAELLARLKAGAAAASTGGGAVGG